MPSSLDPRRLFVEGFPVALVLAFWTLLSGIGAAADPVAAGFRYAGYVMAISYVVVRGVALARSLPGTRLPRDPNELLRENARVAAAAGGWFLPALVIWLLSPHVQVHPLGALWSLFVQPLAIVLTATGLATVLLYAIAVGFPRVIDVGGETYEGADAADGP